MENKNNSETNDSNVQNELQKFSQQIIQTFVGSSSSVVRNASNLNTQMDSILPTDFFKPIADVLLKDVYCYPDDLVVGKEYDAIVLSGGGAKGFIELGMLHCLHVNNCLKNIKHFYGTSIGSVICFLLIIGYEPVELLSHMCINDKDYEIKPSHILSLVTKFGLCSFEKFFEVIEKKAIDKLGFIPTMSELYETYGKEFTCVTYNISKTRTEYLNRIENPNLCCIEALKMSCNIPIIFEKYIYDNSFYIDGAITDNFCIEYADKYLNKGDKKHNILGLDINTFPLALDAGHTNVVTYLHALLTVPFNNNQNKSKVYKSDNVNIISVIIKESAFAFNIPICKKFDYFSLGFRVISDRFLERKPDHIVRFPQESEVETKPLEEKEIDDMLRETKKNEAVEEKEIEVDVCEHNIQQDSIDHNILCNDEEIIRKNVESEEKKVKID